MNYFKLRFFGILLPLLLCLNSLNAELTVTAEFSPAQIAMGDTAKYIIRIKESSSSQSPEPEQISRIPISLPQGLTLRNGRNSLSRQSSIINFKAEYSTTLELSLDAIPETIGEYPIPAFNFEYKGQRLQVPATQLVVVERPEGAAPPTSELLKLKADLPEKLYLGQTYNIKLKLYLYEGVNYHDHQQFERNADGFTVSDLVDATVSQEMLDGHRYRVINWPLAITPIQSGTQDLSFTLSVAVEFPQAQSAHMQDPFFGRNRAFGGGMLNRLFVQAERVDLATGPMQIEVLPLPTEGQPESFSGAVGNFNMQLFTDTERTELGEPITLSIQIVGEGNFSRINGPALPDSPNWRSYDPDSVMKTDDSNSMRGAKRFDYIMIPQAVGQLEVSPVEFSYFDPSTESYVALQTPAFSVEVTPSTHQSNAPITSADLPDSSLSADQAEPSPPNTFLQLERSSKEGHTIGYAKFNRTLFVGFNLLAFLTLSFTCYQLHRRKKLHNDSTYALRKSAKQSMKQAKKAANQSAKWGDASGFYAHAQNAVRSALTYQTGRDFKTAELNTVESALHELNRTAECRTATRELFTQANSQRFSQQSASVDLKAAKRQLRYILKTR